MLTSFARWLVVQSHQRRGAALAVALLLAALSMALTVDRLGMNTDTDALFNQDLPFLKVGEAYDKQFPADTDLTIAVIDAPTKMQAQGAADKLAAALAPRKDLFRSVRNPEGGAFFAHNGLLYLKAEELDELSANLAKAQPMLGAIAADRSARGLFHLLSVAFDAAAEGNPAALGLAPAADQAADVIESVRAGRAKAIDWTGLMAGLSPPDQAPRSFVLTQTVLDTESLEQGGAATSAIREKARELGLTPENGYRVRLTGEVPLNDEEFATVAEGTTISCIAALLFVATLLYLALGSVALVLAAVTTLVLGLVYTLGWATLAVGELNLISMAFAVMFVGIAVDFAIQFLMRYRAERHGGLDLGEALSVTGAAMARPLLLAAVATALGFFSFLPTDYRGVAQLGVIAGGGMLIALIATFTVLPAILRTFGAGGESKEIGYAWAAPLNETLLRRRKAVLMATVAIALVAAAIVPRLTFDFDPLKLKDPTSESMSTILDLMGDTWATPNTVSVLTKTGEEARALSERLGGLPQVRDALTVFDLIPEDQETKLAMIDDLSLILGPVLDASPAPAPTPAEVVVAATELRVKAATFIATGGAAPEMAPLKDAAQKLIVALDGLMADAKPETMTALSASLVGNIDAALTPLRDALAPEKVTLENMPDDLKASWIAADGRYRVQLFPAGDAREITTLTDFVNAVRAVAPDAIGPPVIIYETGKIVTRAFAIAAGLALVTITLLLLAVLRDIGDVLRVLAPLLLAALLTLGTCAATGLALNFANIIGLPLLLGVGVTFPIYLVAAWRDGEGMLLTSPAARGMIFSALTTAGAFGSLAISKHPGTAGLGVLLSLALGYTLLTTLIVLPALLGAPPRAQRRLGV